jgi:hypothetical protein
MKQYWYWPSAIPRLSHPHWSAHNFISACATSSLAPNNADLIVRPVEHYMIHAPLQETPYSYFHIYSISHGK